jgi:hypothetical protein
MGPSLAGETLYQKETKTTIRQILADALACGSFLLCLVAFFTFGFSFSDL